METMTKPSNIKRQHSVAFKLKVALEAIKEADTVSQIASRYSVHPTQIKTWKQKVLDEGIALFEKHQGRELKQKDDLIEQLYTKIGQREIELDWLKKIWSLSTDQKRQLIVRGNLNLTVIRQCELLHLPRSTAYYQPTDWITPWHIDAMHKMDTIYTKYPTFGSRRMKDQLKRWYGQTISRKLVSKLMQVMGVEAIYQRPNTSTPHLQHRIFPYLIKHITAKSPNHIWGTDITYIKINGTWAYLVALLDWYSRYVVSWTLSDSMASDFCVENLQTGLKIA